MRSFREIRRKAVEDGDWGQSDVEDEDDLADEEREQKEEDAALEETWNSLRGRI
jgi:hypothetical protein